MSALEEPKYLIKLREVIAEAKKEMILPKYQSEVGDAEILGALVSKFSKWDFSAILEVIESALEDSNFKLSDLKEVL